MALTEMGANGRWKCVLGDLERDIKCCLMPTRFVDFDMSVAETDSSLSYIHCLRCAYRSH